MHVADNEYHHNKSNKCKRLIFRKSVETTNDVRAVAINIETFVRNRINRPKGFHSPTEYSPSTCKLHSQRGAGHLEI